MIIDMTGGMALNFAVAAYPDEASLLVDTPGLNTIGVVTSDPFPGWSFSQEEPEDPEDGLLWFKTGDPLYCDAAFSAVAGNPIMVYPLSAFQRQSGGWVEVTAKTYQEKDGTAQWVTWIRQTVYLVHDGILKVEFETDSAGAMTVTQGDGNVTFEAGTAAGYAAYSVDLTNYSKLVIDGTFFSTHNYLKFGVWAADAVPGTDKAVTGSNFASASGKTEIDISALSGVYKVGLYLLGGTVYRAVTTNFYLVRS